MKEWKNLFINVQNIETETEKAVLIKMPNNSEYAGYCFWHPQKLIRAGKHSYSIALSYNDDFVFKLKKYGQGKYNKSKVIDAIELTAQQLEEALAPMHENINSTNEGLTVDHHIPEVKIAKKVAVINELKY